MLLSYIQNLRSNIPIINNPTYNILHKQDYNEIALYFKNNYIRTNIGFLCDVSY